VLREETRTRAGRKPKPTAAIVDSSSVKAMPVAGPRGFDGAKTITKVRADKGYTGTAPAEAAAKAGIDLRIVCGPKPAGGFVVQPRRWVVDRTNGWINHHRRLVRQYETTPAAHEGFLMLSQIGLLLRRLDRGQPFDTLWAECPARRRPC
jgi:transposase